MTKKLERVHILLHKLNLQFPSGITTWSDCARRCGNPARGGGACRDCLRQELVEAGADPKVVDIHIAAQRQRAEIEAQIEDSRESVVESVREGTHGKKMPK